MQQQKHDPLKYDQLHKFNKALTHITSTVQCEMHAIPTCLDITSWSVSVGHVGKPCKLAEAKEADQKRWLVNNKSVSL